MQGRGSKSRKGQATGAATDGDDQRVVGGYEPEDGDGVVSLSRGPAIDLSDGESSHSGDSGEEDAAPDMDSPEDKWPLLRDGFCQDYLYFLGNVAPLRGGAPANVSPQRDLPARRPPVSALPVSQGLNAQKGEALLAALTEAERSSQCLAAMNTSFEQVRQAGERHLHAVDVAHGRGRQR